MNISMSTDRIIMILLLVLIVTRRKFSLDQHTGFSGMWKNIFGVGPLGLPSTREPHNVGLDPSRSKMNYSNEQNSR